jgi:hypothetical protein
MTEETVTNNINLSDLALVVQIIDACTKRGAFEGNELVTVGQLRNKVEAFVKANLPKEEVTEQAPAE